MTAKQWLLRARQCDLEIASLLKAKEREHDRLLSITASVDGDPVSHSSDPHKYDGYLELTGALDAKVDELYKIKQEVLDVINQVEDPRLRGILLLRYISFLSWEEIAVQMSYSYMHVCRLHGDALIVVDGILQKML